MLKAKYSEEIKVKIVKEYEEGRGTYRSIAKKYGTGKKSVEDWVRKYREHGEWGIMEKNGNSEYSCAFKRQCVEAVLQGEGSVDDIAAKYNISSRAVLRGCIIESGCAFIILAMRNTVLGNFFALCQRCISSRVCHIDLPFRIVILEFFIGIITLDPSVG